MAIVLDSSNLVAAATDLGVQRDFINNLVEAQAALADAVAIASGVTHSDTSEDSIGLYSTFRAGTDGQTSDQLQAYDRDGDW